MKFPALALWVATAAFAALPSRSAEVSWRVFNITGEVSDVSTEGTLVEARGGADGGDKANEVDGGTFEINGVSFSDAYTLDEPTHTDSIKDRAGVSSAGPKSPYYTLLRFGDRKTSGDAAITFNGLSVGNTYQIQVWASDNAADSPGDARLVLGNGTADSPDPANQQHATLNMEIKEGGPGQYALGTFRADADSQSITARIWRGFTATPAAASNTFINAVQLRQLGAGGPGKPSPPEVNQPRQEVEITRQLYDKPSDRYFLEWTSNAGETYGIYLTGNAGAMKTCIAASVDGVAGKTSFGPFPNPRPGNADLAFEIGPPDRTPPACNRVWGNGTTISLHFSEAMLPGPATSASNFTVTRDNGIRVAVDAATFQPGEDTVVLTTTQPLEPGAAYSVAMRDLRDRANLPLVEPSANFRTWKDDPNGVKVFILAGQSNMVGWGHHDKGRGDKIGGVGSLREKVEKDPQNYGHLVEKDGKWRAIDSMMFWWNRADPGASPRISKGQMTVGYGAGSDCIGPEYGFGMTIHQFYQNDPVLVIKTAWGGKSLHLDYCSPTAASRRDGRIGPYYLQMMDQVHQVLDQLDREFPLFEGLGYQITGFGWHQGYDDMLDEVKTLAYEQNMADFIRDIRAEFGKPKLPFSIATTGQGGTSVTLKDRPMLAGQLAVADARKYPEFAGNVFTVDTRPFQRTAELSPKSDSRHWHNNGETLYLIGKGMGEGMLEMLNR